MTIKEDAAMHYHPEHESGYSSTINATTIELEDAQPVEGVGYIPPNLLVSAPVLSRAMVRDEPDIAVDFLEASPRDPLLDGPLIDPSQQGVAQEEESKRAGQKDCCCDCPCCLNTHNQHACCDLCCNCLLNCPMDQDCCCLPDVCFQSGCSLLADADHSYCCQDGCDVCCFQSGCSLLADHCCQNGLDAGLHFCVHCLSGLLHCLSSSN